METPQTHSLVVLSAQRVSYLHPDQLTDLIEYFAPDGMLLIGDGASPPIVEQSKFELQKVLPDEVTFHSLVTDTPDVFTTDTGTLLILPGETTQETVGQLLQQATEPTFVFTDAVSVSVSQLDLTATIEGLAPFQGHDEPLTVFSAALDASYWREVDKTTLRGLAPEPGSTPKVPCLTLGSDGGVTKKTLKEGRLGLRALDGVGDSIGPTLRRAGYESIEDIYNAERSKLTALNGISDYQAERLQKSAESFIEGTVVRFDDEATLPSDVVHIDIETDGLTPSIIWQIGVYDPQAGEYEIFVQKDPAEKAPILREFGSWLKANLNGRAISAYHGEGFDFEHLDNFFRQHCPEYHETWRRAHKVDPLEWVATKRNATFPSRVNKLGEVAEALGYEHDETGLDGAATGRAYSRWMANPCEETELDWDRHTAYCRDDVLALNHVYEAILDSGRLLVDHNPNRPTDDNTEQGTLFDY